MSKPFEPWIKYPTLTPERLAVIGDLISDARSGTVRLHDPEGGDSVWSLGCRVYARTCFAIIQSARSLDWLTIIPDEKPLRFVFAIGGLPVRFYSGDPDDTPSRFLYASPSEQMSLTLIAEIEGTPVGEGILRLAVEIDQSFHAHRIVLIEMDEKRNQTGFYEIPLGTSVRVLQPMGVSLPPATVQPLVEKQEGVESSERKLRDAG